MIELQPIMGNKDAGVLHMLPGGVENPENWPEGLRDIYAFTAVGFGNSRGGHYHKELNEFFFTVSGTALRILSDFRIDSSTYGKTIGVILGAKKPGEAHDVPVYVLENGDHARLRVPAGIYHAIYPLSEERLLSIGIGSTPYNTNDYIHPKLEEIPGVILILKTFGLPTSAPASK